MEPMKDFTISIYTELLERLRYRGYTFKSIEDFTDSPVGKVVMLRHDVDLRNYAALRLAKVESSLGVRSTYYFRAVKQSHNPKVIRQIVEMGHEIGYHYEDLATHDGDYDAAIRAFEQNLSLFRQYYPIRTVCMHGSSGSPYDNRDLWKKYSLEDFGLIAEPYLSFDFNKVLYLSDTGRRWNGNKMSLRDKVESAYAYNFRGTFDIIKAVGILPEQLLITAHPEQWTELLPEWLFVKSFSIAHTLYKVHYRNRKIRGEI